MTTQTVHELSQRSRKYARVAFALGVLSFVGAIGSQSLFGAQLPWTSWVMPLLVSTNAGVMLLPQANKHPRATALYFSVSGLVALIILGAIVVQMVQGSR
jgi:hypothetical protein